MNQLYKKHSIYTDINTIFKTEAISSTFPSTHGILVFLLVYFPSINMIHGPSKTKQNYAVLVECLYGGGDFCFKYIKHFGNSTIDQHVHNGNFLGTYLTQW